MSDCNSDGNKELRWMPISSILTDLSPVRHRFEAPTSTIQLRVFPFHFFSFIFYCPKK